MKILCAITFWLFLFSSFSYCQTYVQKWENWQSDLFVTNNVADGQNRNVGLHLWSDKGFGMELHWRDNRWGTAVFTRGNEDAIWLGKYGSNETQQQTFVLYLIDQNKQIEEQNKQINKQNRKIDELRKEVKKSNFSRR